MKTYVLYASMYGHTEVLAQAVAEGARRSGECEVVLKSVEEVEPDELKSADAIIWGSSGYFGTPNPKMSAFFGKLGQLWFTGALQGKIGGVFGTTSTQHGGVENLLKSLQTPMEHQGMIVVSSTGPYSAERVQFGCPYGAAAVIPVEASPTAPMNRPNETEMALAREFGQQVADAAAKLTMATVTLR